MTKVGTVAEGSGRCTMLELDLDRDELEILADFLETRLADLRMEIGRTDRQAYREMLKLRKRVLQKTIACLRGEPSPEAGVATGQACRP